MRVLAQKNEEKKHQNSGNFGIFLKKKNGCPNPQNQGLEIYVYLSSKGPKSKCRILKFREFLTILEKKWQIWGL